MAALAADAGDKATAITATAPARAVISLCVMEFFM
jgi:hypothetical protein